MKLSFVRGLMDPIPVAARFHAGGRTMAPSSDAIASPVGTAIVADEFSALQVLSAEGSFSASDEAKKVLCLLSDGKLLVAEGQGLNSHVLSYCARLQMMNRPYEAIFVGIQEIRRMYSSVGEHAADRHLEHTSMQITAKELLNKACHERASDIHIRVKKHDTEIYFRIHNDLVRTGNQTREYGERLLATLYGAMTSTSDNAYKPTERQDASIGDRDKLPPQLYGVRIATTPTSDGTAMVLRLLYNDAGDTVELQRLGFSDTHAAQLQKVKEQPIGMNIISGPTGSGKSTTLQRVLTGELREAEGKLHVITIEDPVEYPIEGAVQTSVTNASTEDERSRLFSAAIANAMRLDPDTIMVGEIRDRASGQNALRAAMTGHQVWTTVHANTAVAIVDRLVDLGLPLSLVADHTIVTSLISQRLVKVLCPHCKKKLAGNEGQFPESAIARIRQAIPEKFSEVCVAGPGCRECRNQGTTGRSVVAEIILPDEQFFKYVRAGDKGEAVQYWLQELGGRTMLGHVIEKVEAGIVDPLMAEKAVGHLTIGMPKMRKRSVARGAIHVA